MKQEEILDVLRKVAPGTTLRDGLDNILKAKTGAGTAVATVSTPVLVVFSRV